MKSTVRAKGTEVTDALRIYVEKKLENLEKYFDDAEATVMLRLESGVHIAEVTIRFHSYTLRAEHRTGDMYASIDVAFENLERQYLRHKTKLDKKHKSRGVKEVNKQEFDRTVREAPEGTILRRKVFQLKPMNEEEAIMQMELLGHSFFVFMNAATEQVNVLYRRTDGAYGLIESE